MDYRRKFFVISLVFCLGFFSLQASGSLEKEYGDRLVIGTHNKLNPINPLIYENGYSVSLYPYLFDSLVEFDNNFKPQPRLASSWKVSDGGRVWTFSLREGVKFHDGTALTASDVKFSFDSYQDMARKGLHSDRDLKYIQEVKIINPLTVRFVFSKTQAQGLWAFTSPILPKHILAAGEDSIDKFNQHPIGSGPFALIRMNEREALFKANPDYFLGRPHLDGIEVKSYQTPDLAWQNLLSGNVDLIDDIEPAKVVLSKLDGSFKTHYSLFPYYFLAAFNHKKHFFQEQNVLQALNYAVNKEKILKEALNGIGQIASGTVYPGSWAEAKDLAPYPYDPKMAKKLLQEAGWTLGKDNILTREGKKFSLVLDIIKGDKVLETAASIIQENLKAVGIEVKVNPLMWVDLEPKRLAPKVFDMALIPFLGKNPEDNYFFWHSSQIESGFNVFSYQSPDIDQLLEKAEATFDSRQRKEIYVQIQKKLHDNPPGIFLFWKDRMMVVDKRFRGIKPGVFRTVDNLIAWYVPKEEQKRAN
jgi:peptide/nickel transport system substrate-binding protein